MVTQKIKKLSEFNVLTAFLYIILIIYALAGPALLLEKFYNTFYMGGSNGIANVRRRKHIYLDCCREHVHYNLKGNCFA